MHVASMAALRQAAKRTALTLATEAVPCGASEVLQAAGSGATPLARGLQAMVLREVQVLVQDVRRVARCCQEVPYLALQLPGDAPALQGPLSFFLGGFMPEAVECAKMLTEAALGQQDLVPQLVEKARA